MTTSVASSTTNLSIYTDGGARGNPGPAAAAYIIKDSCGQVIKKGGQYLGVKTNNEAEYTGILLSLEAIRSLSLSLPIQLTFYSDSLLIANQLKGTYKIKEPRLAALAAAVHCSLSTTHYSSIFVSIPREQNREADAEVNYILDHTPISGIY